MNTDTNTQTQPTPKQPLGEGNILVWRRGNETVLHHTNGLTIALNRQERQDLLVWLLKEQEGER